jgi:hypothetical protein
MASKRARRWATLALGAGLLAACGGTLLAQKPDSVGTERAREPAPERVMAPGAAALRSGEMLARVPAVQVRAWCYCAASAPHDACVAFSGGRVADPLCVGGVQNSTPLCALIPARGTFSSGEFFAGAAAAAARMEAGFPANQVNPFLADTPGCTAACARAGREGPVTYVPVSYTLVPQGAVVP